MRGEQNDRNAALAELRTWLSRGLARSRLTKTQLAMQAGLGRVTVSEAFKVNGPPPSARTVAALARALRLPAEELLRLRREAALVLEQPGLGRPIRMWEPHELEIHPAGSGGALISPSGSVMPALPRYVAREHDLVLADAVRDAAAGCSRLVVLVGSSSTGKTRACWEAVQPLAEMGWRLWHPFEPTRAQAVLEDLHRVGPQTVVWLNEAQHYLGDRVAGEQIAAAIHHLLVSPQRGPVLVLGTLWPEYARYYTALPTPGEPDHHSQVRELLVGRTLPVPDTFDTAALDAASALADEGDALLADALTRVRDDGRITQDLAGAPALLNRYKQATPAARALLYAAMDARRLGVGLHLPLAFLTDAAIDYLTDTDYDHLTDDWAEHAFAELAQPVHGKQAPLRRSTLRPPRRPPATPTSAGGPVAPQPAGPQARLANYLEHHGRTTRKHLCPPASFWYAAHTHLTQPDDLNCLAEAAEDRHRLQWARQLRQDAADHGSTSALVGLAVLSEEAGDREGAEALARRAADHGDTRALFRLAELREEAGDREGAEALYRQAVDCGDTRALFRLAELREEAGDREGAEALARRAADHGHTEALFRDTRALFRLAELREEAGDREGAEALARQAADHGNAAALYRLAMMRGEAGDREGAADLLRQAAEHGSTAALYRLAEMREEAGEREGAEALARHAAEHGSTAALYRLAEMREEAGEREGAEALARHAAEHGSTDALYRLAEMREEAGEREGAEMLLWQAAEHGSIDALYRLAEKREERGDRAGAEVLALQVANHGSVALRWTMMRGLLNRLWPNGLDPDGAPTLPWQPSALTLRGRHEPPDALRDGNRVSGEPLTAGHGQPDDRATAHAVAGCRIGLELLDDHSPSVDASSRIGLQLHADPGHPWAVPGSRQRPTLEVVAAALGPATIEPGRGFYNPLDVLEFTFVPRRPGRHLIRFTLYETASGAALQQVETLLTVTEAAHDDEALVPTAERRRR
ncbi:tetratricopeptide repeat protein [Streptomyces europaeiscabiei]|uniref:tetratricopeptide repeat protein n=1 Tax=Streptomyces europaeiscabiei TaxID=146819 RepID=UPI0029BEDF71|nr:tetratricopeptide repeat protein [Streptomyces europaeiscabiei]MDX3716153.1 tetratricopeptide repeat protein [Streptomyces europaeiscabiei]MDX3867040.1 tetratricopeptide repeat protein [Streptomyces europaeiscabiei]MDX3875544.1 tetratricopeptide repeat protein [Streptomyces europaeiscabiei]